MAGSMIKQNLHRIVLRHMTVAFAWYTRLSSMLFEIFPSTVVQGNRAHFSHLSNSRLRLRTIASQEQVLVMPTPTLALNICSGLWQATCAKEGSTVAVQPRYRVYSCEYCRDLLHVRLPNEARGFRNLTQIRSVLLYAVVL